MSELLWFLVLVVITALIVRKIIISHILGYLRLAME